MCAGRAQSRVCEAVNISIVRSNCGGDGVSVSHASEVPHCDALSCLITRLNPGGEAAVRVASQEPQRSHLGH